MTTPCHGTEPEYLTRQEAADLLRVDVQTIDRLARSGRLTRYRIATGDQRSRTRYRADEVRGLIRPETAE
jgi:excisionase family DNA binding protein